MVADYLMFPPLKVGGRRVQVVDLFCGGGGFSEGALQAGCEVVVSIDAWQPAIITHRLNHPNTPCLKFELGGSIEECAALIKLYLKEGMHFHLHASPPCQALSNASSANPADGLGLVDWTLALVEYMKPDSWSLENVIPLAKHLKVRDVPFEKLNAAAFGVPQLRKRVFAGEGWVAKESHSKDQFVSVLDALPHLNGELRAAPCMKKRWPNLSVENPSHTVTSKSISQMQIVSRRRKKGEAPQAYSPTKPAHTITQLPGVIEEFKLQSTGASYGLRHRDKTLIEPSLTVTGANGMGVGIYRHITHIRGTSRTNPIVENGEYKGTEPLKFPDGFRTVDQPAYVVCHRSLDAHAKAERVRSLTIEETCTLQGWPGMKIPDTPKTIKKKQAWQIIGNMVCPPVAKAIMEGLK